MIHVDLVHDCLRISELIDKVRCPQAGAIVTFTGTTRDSFQGKEVQSLEYEAFTPLAKSSMRKIAEACLEKYGLHHVAIEHRLGSVPVGQDSIVIAVSSSHREAGWRGAEAILEQVKAQVEVWKREVYKDGSMWKENEKFTPGGKTRN